MTLDLGVVGSAGVVVEYSVREKFVILGVCGVVVPLAASEVLLEAAVGGVTGRDILTGVGGEMDTRGASALRGSRRVARPLRCGARVDW